VVENSVLRTGNIVRFLLAIFLVVGLPGTTWSEDGTFKTYDLTALSYLPPSLVEKGYQPIHIIQMCEIWDLKHRYGKEPCGVKNYSEPDEFVVRKRAEESLGLPVVAISIEQNAEPSSVGWNFRSEDPEVVETAVRRWQKLVKIWREVNPDTKILIYGPMPRIWWPLKKNRKYATLSLGQSDIDARWEKSKLIAPLFEDKSLIPWVSAYMKSNEVDLYREERRWQIKVCKELYKSKCIFAISPLYVQKQSNLRRDRFMKPEAFYDYLVSLKEDGADGIGMWIYIRYENERYINLLKQWDEKGGRTTPTEDERVLWLDVVDRFLSEDLHAT
jgi:hypothetical protein